MESLGINVYLLNSFLFGKLMGRIGTAKGVDVRRYVPVVGVGPVSRSSLSGSFPLSAVVWGSHAIIDKVNIIKTAQIK